MEEVKPEEVKPNLPAKVRVWLTLGAEGEIDFSQMSKTGCAAFVHSLIKGASHNLAVVELIDPTDGRCFAKSEVPLEDVVFLLCDYGKKAIGNDLPDSKLIVPQATFISKEPE